MLDLALSYRREYRSVSLPNAYDWLRPRACEYKQACGWILSSLFSSFFYKLKLKNPMQTQSIGVDVGKTELVASIRDSDGNSAMPALFPNSSLGLKVSCLLKGK